MQLHEPAPVPSSTSTGQHRRRTDVATSLPPWRAPPGNRARDDNRGRDRVCLHWPLQGAATIQANACALAALAQRCADAAPAGGAWPPMRPHCIDVHTPASATETARLRVWAQALSGELDSIRQYVRAIARDFVGTSPGAAHRADLDDRPYQPAAASPTLWCLSGYFASRRARSSAPLADGGVEGGYLNLARPGADRDVGSIALPVFNFADDARVLGHGCTNIGMRVRGPVKSERFSVYR